MIMNLTLRTLDREGIHLWFWVFTALLEKRKKSGCPEKKSISREERHKCVTDRACLQLQEYKGTWKEAEEPSCGLQ